MDSNSVENWDVAVVFLAQSPEFVGTETFDE